MWFSNSENKQKVIKSKRQAIGNRFSFTKRRRFLLVSLALTVGLFVVQRFPVESRIYVFGIYGLISYLLCAWSLFRDLRGVSWVSNLILPTLYPVAVGLFYFLLPQYEVTKIMVAVIFLISMYALLLTSNIFAVASIRTIQLLRAARAVGFLLTVLTAAFLFHFIFSLRVGVLYIFGMSSLVTYPLFLFGIWSYTLGDKLLGRDLMRALVGTLVVVEVAVAISFWQIDVSLISIYLSMIVYVVLGILQHELEDRLFARTIQEYVGFGMLVFGIIVAMVMTRWIG
ncbi:MAG: hypothetical protein WCL07_03975 [bacterium]